MNNSRKSLREHCEWMCNRYKKHPESGIYVEHRAILDLLDKTEWIPVSERLPEERHTYEVTLQGIGELEGIDNEVAYATWLGNKNNWLYHDVNNWKDKEVIAWKPRSRPYKAESEDKG